MSPSLWLKEYVDQVGPPFWLDSREHRQIPVRVVQAALAVGLAGRVFHEGLVRVEVVRLGVDQLARSRRAGSRCSWAPHATDHPGTFFGSSACQTRHVGSGRFGNRLRRVARLPRVLRHRRFVGLEERLAGGAIEHEEMRRLAAVVDRLARLAADRDVGQKRRVHVVHVPDVLVDGLEVPLVGAGLEIERDQRVGEEILTRTSRAVLRPAAAPRVGEGVVRHAELGIDRAVDPGVAAASRSTHVPPAVAGIGRDAVHVGDDPARLRDAVERPDHAAVTRPQAGDRVAGRCSSAHVDHAVVIERARLRQGP